MLLWGYAFMLHLLAREMHAAAGMTADDVADARAAKALPIPLHLTLPLTPAQP